jgi:hypothetical protein
VRAGHFETTVQCLPHKTEAAKKHAMRAQAKYDTSRFWPAIFSAEPRNFSSEDGTYAWFRGIPDGDDYLENDTEWRATISPHILDTLSGHFPYDPSKMSMKQYPSRAEAIDALIRATIPVEPFVPEPIRVETT